MLKQSPPEIVQSTIWRVMGDPDEKLLVLEIRDANQKIVSFALYDLEMKDWRWKDVVLEEKWWVSVAAVSAGVILFTVYLDQQNPDKKSLIAVDRDRKEMLWWKNNFSVSQVAGQIVTGVDSTMGTRELIMDIRSGNPRSRDILGSQSQNFPVLRPFHYVEGSEYFETVKQFLETRQNFSPRYSVEYCEHQSLICISAFMGENDLANYLFVFNSDGELLEKHTLGEHLKGIATDTFFIYAGFLIFVKNKRELIRYKLYD